MPVDDHGLALYRELAECYDRQGQPQLRDRFLVLAADAALAADQTDKAEDLRGRLLSANPHHLLKPFASFVQAMQSSDVQTYVKDLRQGYPVDTARGLLDSLRDGRVPKQPVPRASDSDPDLILSLDDPPPEENGPLKVYRVRESAKEPPPAPLPPPVQPKPTKKTMPTLGQSGPKRGPQPAPSAYPVRSVPRPQPSSSPYYERFPDEQAHATGGWFTSFLFLLVAVVGLGLAVYTIARPFLPPGWQPPK